MSVKTILVADDNEANAEVIRLILEGEGYHVITSPDAVELENTAVPIPDLVLLDIKLPGRDGKDICRQLKQDTHTQHLPVILMTATNEHREPAIAAGAVDFILKPFELQELVEKVNKVLKKGHKPGDQG